MRGPAGLGHQAHSQRTQAPGRGKVERMFETIRRQFLVEVTGDGDPARHHVTSLDEVNQLLDYWGAQGPPPAGALPDRADSPPAVGGRPGRSAGRRAAAGGARLDGACHRAAHNPHRTRTLISLVARCRKGLLVGVTARTWAPAGGVELCPVLAGQQRTRATGCWVRMPGTGIAGHGGRDGRREPRREQCVFQLYRFKTRSHG